MTDGDRLPTDRLWLPYTQMKGAMPPLAASRTDGVRIVLDDGRELIDGIASWWTACHGYNHPHIAAAVQDQLHRMPHVMFGGLVHEPAARLARRLGDLLPGRLNRVFFSDSGSVAVEVAMKMAVQFWINRGVAGRAKFVSFRHGYHGDTLGAMSVTDPEDGMHRLFKGFLPDQIVVDLPRDDGSLAMFDSLLDRARERIAAVIVEPLVQGAGGMKFHEPRVLAAVREACTRNGHLLIADEVMTGFGRTGRMFACQEADIVPDVICLSKALTGGTMGLAATVASDEVFDAFYDDAPEAALMHGPTFMANPLACAAANASLDLFESEDRLGRVAAIESELRESLEPCRGLAGVADVRVKGAIGVVQLENPGNLDWMKRRFIDKGVWLRPFGDIVYTAPPFTISQADLARVGGAMRDVVREWSTARANSEK